MSLAEVMEMLKGLEKQNDDLHKKAIAKLNKLEQEIVDLKKKNEEKTKKIIELEGKITQLEDEKKQNNLVIFGIDEDESEEPKDLQTKVSALVVEKLKCTLEPSDVNFMKRMGKKNKNKSRAVIIGLSTVKRKWEIMSNCNKLAGTKMAVCEEFSKNVLERRKQLIPLMKEMRAAGKHAVLKADKLYVDGELYEEHSIKPSPVSTDKGENSVSPTYNKRKKAKRF
ncbi:hypothetical protein M8J76_014898 [Diaphorina citri]|nr:hypothetical protein M8J75_000173 [Diaphorina citri]KAI5737584.1 hypothetical protein M8J76_014898 [Diaphorina citri]